MNTPSNSPHDFFGDVDRARVPTWTTPADLAHQSIEASLSQGHIVPETPRASIRLTGTATNANSIPVSLGATFLGRLQELVTAVGSSLRDKKGTRGRYTEEVRSQTELRMIPQLTPGSIVFWITVQPQTTEGPPALLPRRSLATESVDKILSVARFAMLEEVQSDNLVQELQGLGPRVARHLLRLSDTLIEADLEMQVSWTDPGQGIIQGELTHPAAVRMRDAISSNRVDVDIVQLTGILQTVSRIRDIDLLLDTGRTLRLSIVDDDLRRRLGAYYDRRVVVTAEESIRILGSGEERTSYNVVDIAGDDDPFGSPT